MLETFGLLVTLEGIDGCGKSTQFAMLRRELEQRAIPCTAVREPGATPAGEGIRRILLHNDYHLSASTELLLYMAARVELTERLLLPALRKGRLVLCDRYTDSTLAYQGYGSGLDLQWIRRLNCRVTRGLVPDLTFLLDLPVEEAKARRNADADRMEGKDRHYHQRVRRGYLEIAALDQERFAVIDASLDAEQQGLLIWQSVRRLIEERAGDGHNREF